MDNTEKSVRRTGDTIPIEGAYQYHALYHGNPVQRFWHLSKQLVIDQFLPPQPGEQVLDVGCGSGVIAHHLAQLGARVTAVDGNQEAIDFANQTFASESLRFVHGLVDDTFLLDSPVDKIYCLEVIEHVYYEQALAMLHNFYGLLRPGGHVLLTTPNYRSLWPIIEFLCDTFMSTAKMGGDQHVCHYTSSRLKYLARHTGFHLEHLRSFCLFAPWLAPLSVTVAKRVHTLEVHAPLRVGALLVAVLRKVENYPNTPRIT